MKSKRIKGILVFGIAVFSLQPVCMPVGMVYAKMMATQEEAPEQADLPALPSFLETTEETNPRFFFQQSYMQGTVNEQINVTISSDQAASEVRVRLPEAGQVLNEQLPAGVSIEQETHSKEWVMQTQRAQNTFILPLVFEFEGNYELSVEETTAYLEISEQEDEQLDIIDEPSEENRTEIVEDDSTKDLPEETQGIPGKGAASFKSEKNATTIENPDYLPIVHLVKDTESGVLVASEIDTSYGIFLYPTTIMTKSPDNNNILGNQALQFISTTGGERGVELSAPLYSNTNYTMQVRGRLSNPSLGEMSPSSPVRYGVKTGHTEIYASDFTQSYSNRAISFTSNNRFHNYQTIPSERTIFYLYDRSSNQGGFWSRVTFVRMIPNTPMISFVGDSYLDVNLSEVIGKTNEQIVEDFSKEIEEKLKTIAVDSNNNNNIISSVDIESIEDSFKVVCRNSKEIKVNTKAAKWGEVGLNSFTINIIDDTILPLDPLNPEIEVDPENKPVLEEEQGLLSIDFASQFRFGKQAISAQAKCYYAQPQRLLNLDGTVNDAEERPNYIQVSDRRPEEERHGWQLAVTQNSQFSDRQDNQLRGARLLLNNQQLASVQETGEPMLQNEDGVVLIPEEKTTLVSAREGQGVGSWVYRFGDGESAGESVALEVPPTADPRATIYQTTLTWELSTVPDN
ncbi:WxL domain-containing protein [Enterococcus mundtii]|uniref:WxL domain-containing protein n=1 Tax=Enterococcus mundtii TaxID=53346 RepID=A0A2S7S012_ENTMU|nr:WxL domain-containing protein [Enterococcus mundtii]PQF25878.1 hypothetical protein CUS89_00775 [Enterococcus mundtii]